MKKILVFLIVALSFLSFSAQSQVAIESRIKDLMESTPVMGLSVAVVRDGELVYERAFGWKKEGEVPLSTTDIFRIASISKSFSATSIMQLVEKRQLRLEDDVSNLIGFKVRNPRFPDVVITLRMLLSHTSSLNDSEGYFTLDAINPAENPNWENGYNDYAPGQGYQYSNLAYNMTGAIIEKYSGERFDQYVRGHILAPLGLYGGYNVNELDASSFASIYEYNPDSAKFFSSPAAYSPRTEDITNYRFGYSTPIFSPTGGIKISAPDLARYMIVHMNYGKSGNVKIMGKKSAQIMQTPHSSEENYGLALMKTDKLIAGQELTGHTGSAYGLYSAMFFDPEEKFGIVVISNGCDPSYVGGFNRVIRESVNILYEGLIKP